MKHMSKKTLRRRLISVGVFIMNEIDSLKEQIEKTEVILAESRENYEKNPGEYSARLLLMSTENYLTDLLKQLDSLIGQE
jgi:hypothetical protein